MTIVEYEQWVQFFNQPAKPLPPGKTYADWWKVPHAYRVEILSIALYQ